MIAFSEVTIGSGRAQLCSACSRRAGGVSGEPSGLEAVRGEIASSARSWTRGPGPNVVLVGFEPFSHPELPAIIRAAVDLGCARIMLETDAGALAIAGNVEGVLAAGVRHLEVTLLAEGLEHDRLTGRQGLFAAATAGVRSFVETARRADTPVAVCGLVPVCRHNSAHAAAAVASLASLGAVAVHLDAESCPERDAARVIAALDTAATNAIAGSVSGLAGSVPAPWGVRPWERMVGGMA